MRFIPLVFCKSFFNISSHSYEAHHIKQKSRFPELYSSIFNLYPLRKQVHRSKLYNFHSHDYDERGVRDFPFVAKLKYHKYPDFQFLDFNSKLQTSFDHKLNYFDYKKYMAGKGINFIPIENRDFSLSDVKLLTLKLKEIAYPYFPDVYRYTGECVRVLHGKDLYTTPIKKPLADDFIHNNSFVKFYGDLNFGVFPFWDPEHLLAVFSFVKEDNVYIFTGSAVQKGFYLLGLFKKVMSYFSHTFGIKHLFLYKDLCFYPLSKDFIGLYDGVEKNNNNVPYLGSSSFGFYRYKLEL